MSDPNDRNRVSGGGGGGGKGTQLNPGFTTQIVVALLDRSTLSFCCLLLSRPRDIVDMRILSAPSRHYDLQQLHYTTNSPPLLEEWLVSKVR